METRRILLRKCRDEVHGLFHFFLRDKSPRRRLGIAPHQSPGDGQFDGVTFVDEQPGGLDRPRHARRVPVRAGNQQPPRLTWQRCCTRAEELRVHGIHQHGAFARGASEKTIRRFAAKLALIHDEIGKPQQPPHRAVYLFGVAARPRGIADAVLIPDKPRPLRLRPAHEILGKPRRRAADEVEDVEVRFFLGENFTQREQLHFSTGDKFTVVEHAAEVDRGRVC